MGTENSQKPVENSQKPVENSQKPVDQGRGKGCIFELIGV